MADEDLDLDLDEEKKGGKLKLIIIAVVVLLLGAGAAMYFMGLGPFAKEEPVAEQQAEPETPPEPEVTIYEGMDDVMVINLASGKHPRYLQLGVKFLVRSESASKALQLHMPVIRNDIQEIVSVKSYADLQQTGAKKALRKQILEDANRVLEEKSGEKYLVKDVFFDTFVVQ